MFHIIQFNFKIGARLSCASFHVVCMGPYAVSSVLFPEVPKAHRWDWIGANGIPLFLSTMSRISLNFIELHASFFFLVNTPTVSKIWIRFPAHVFWALQGSHMYWGEVPQACCCMCVALVMVRLEASLSYSLLLAWLFNPKRQFVKSVQSEGSRKESTLAHSFVAVHN